MRTAVNGAAGAMGKCLVRLILEAGDMELAAAVERAGHPLLGADAGVLAGVGATGVLLSDVLAGAPEHVQVG